METIGYEQKQALHRAELAALGRAQRKSTEPGEALPVTAADRREQVQQFLRRYRQAVAQAEDLAGEVQALRLLRTGWAARCRPPARRWPGWNS